MKLSELNYSVEYVKGDRHLVSDALSHGPVESSTETKVASLHVFGICMKTD